MSSSTMSREKRRRQLWALTPTEKLRELGFPYIAGDPSLQMHANFDRNLHIIPDLGGEKGERKRKEAADFWEALAFEISIYLRSDCVNEGGDNCEQMFHPRLPSMFETLQDVLKTLIPKDDHPSIMQNLDVSLMMQQIYKGVFDMVGLTNWLAALLKTYCAPMRDELVDQMVGRVSLGSQTQDPNEIVQGLQTLFTVLEAMKLDIANLQIRESRILLIQNTIPFLQNYFCGLGRGSIQMEPSKHWFLKLCEDNRDDTETTDEFWPVATLLKGLLELLSQFDPPDSFPETFIFNSDQLWQLRATLQSMINLNICWNIFRSYIHTRKVYLGTPAETYSKFSFRIWMLRRNGWMPFL